MTINTIENVPQAELFHFYHLWVGGDATIWPVVLHEHLDALICSGLLFMLKDFFIGFVGPVDQIKQAQHLLNTRQISYKTIACAADGFEQKTQTPMFDFISKYCLDENDKHDTNTRKKCCYALYCHNKGSFNIGQEWWRRAMTYYTIFEWQACVQSLDTNQYDVVGIHWLKPEVYGKELISSPFFGGNFWWATFDHIKHLGGPPNTSSRYDAEAWIGTALHTRALDRKPQAGWPTYHSADPNT